MKKLYSLLAAGFVAASASAAVPGLSVNPTGMTPEGQRLMNERTARMIANPGMIKQENVLGTRSFTSSDGTIWTIRVVNDTEEMPWYRVLGFVDEDGNPIPDDQKKFSDYPFYTVITLMAGYDGNTGQIKNYLPVYHFWPSHYYYDQVWSVSGDADIPEDERDYSIVSLYEMSTGAKDSWCNIFKECTYTAQGQMNPNPILNAAGDGVENWSTFPCPLIPDAQFMWNGSTCQTYQDGSTVLTFTFNDYLVDSNELNVEARMPIQYTTSSGGSRKTSYTLKYNGTIWDDMAPHNINLGISELHIFNTGVTSSKTMGAKNPYWPDWGPLTRYYYMATLNDYITVNIPDDMTAIDTDRIGFIFKEDVDPSIQINPESQSFMNGALYSADDSKEPTGKWNVLTPTWEYDPDFQIVVITMAPKAGAAIPAYTPVPTDDKGQTVELPDQTYPSVDGSVIYYMGNSLSPVAGATIGNGTLAGFELNGKDLFNNNLYINFDGKYYYHGDPANVKSVEMLESIGKDTGVDNVVEAGDAVISVVNGEVVINAKDNVSVEVYTLDGAAVARVNVLGGEARSLKLDNGLYIIKAGNEVKKVIL